MVLGIRDNSEVRGEGYVLPGPPPEENNEDVRRRCLKIVELQEKLKTEARRTTRSYNHLKGFVESSVQDMKSSLTEISEPVANSHAISIASILGGAVITGFGLMSISPKPNAEPPTSSLFRNPEVLKGLYIAAGAGLFIGGIVYYYSKTHSRKHKLWWCLNEIRNRRSKYFESLVKAYNVAEDLKRKRNDARYSEIFLEMFPIDSQHYRIANEMFNMTRQIAEFIQENSPFSRRNEPTPPLDFQNIQIIYESITRIQREMDRVEEAKNALPNLHSFE